MAIGIKISDLNFTQSISGSSLIPIVQGGQTLATSVTSIAAAASDLQAVLIQGNTTTQTISTSNDVIANNGRFANILSAGQNIIDIFNTDTSINLQDVTDNGNTSTNSIQVASLTACGKIIGGINNTANGSQSFVGGGVNNKASGSKSIVAGGEENTASGDCSTVGGGDCNNASGIWSTITGGVSNCAPGHVSFIGGGVSNCASGIQATIGGGVCNYAGATLATVGGGWYNETSGNCSGILGGENNTITHDNSFIIGSNLTSNAACTTFVNNLSAQCNIYAGGALTQTITAGNMELTICGGLIYSVTDVADILGA
jgi:hypothetical protein